MPRSCADDSEQPTLSATIRRRTGKGPLLYSHALATKSINLFACFYDIFSDGPVQKPRLSIDRNCADGEFSLRAEIRAQRSWTTAAFPCKMFDFHAIMFRSAQPKATVELAPVV